MKPAILLIRPQMGENIGAAARAMANFGLQDLRLVAPRDGWPNPKASDTAGKALNLIDEASVHETVSRALADCQFVLATTARERAMNLPVMELREAMGEMRARAATGQKCALMFGPERTGLENEDMALADAVVTIPVAPDYTSLNIAQAVVVTAYEWWMTNRLPIVGPPPPFPNEGSSAVAAATMPVTRAQLEGLFGQLEAALDRENFWRVPEKKEVMWRNIRATLVRAGLTGQEIATWRGMIKALRSH